MAGLHCRTNNLKIPSLKIKRILRCCIMSPVSQLGIVLCAFLPLDQATEAAHLEPYRLPWREEREDGESHPDPETFAPQGVT